MRRIRIWPIPINQTYFFIQLYTYIVVWLDIFLLFCFFYSMHILSNKNEPLCYVIAGNVSHYNVLIYFIIWSRFYAVKCKLTDYAKLLLNKMSCLWNNITCCINPWSVVQISVAGHHSWTSQITILESIIVWSIHDVCL